MGTTVTARKLSSCELALPGCVTPGPQGRAVPYRRSPWVSTKGNKSSWQVPDARTTFLQTPPQWCVERLLTQHLHWVTLVSDLTYPPVAWLAIPWPLFPEEQILG